MTENQTETDSAQDAAQEVKVFRFRYEKTKSVTNCVFVPAKTEEEAKAFIKTQEEWGNLEYQLDTNVNRDDWTDGEWELLGVEETVNDQYNTWDYEEDVVPALNPEEEE